MDTSQQTLGFIGLGLMGSRMVARLAKQGWTVTVWNRTRERAETLSPLGVQVAGSPRELASQVDVVCTCVSDPAALREVMHGPEGVFASARAGQLFIDFSTVSPDDTRALAAECAPRGIDFVEAPMTGSKAGAEKGTLVLMVGGEDGALARARPLFDAVAEKVIACGPVGAGSQVKLAGNALIAMMLEGFSEALLLTKKAGVDPRKLIEVVQASGYRSPYYDFKGKALLERDFDTHFSIDLMFKDLSLFLDSAARHRIPTPGVAAVRETYQLARAHGQGDKDIAAVVTALEALSGTRIA